MNLKEYYKEILNNLLMTETTASPKNQPVEPGSLRAKRLGGLQAEYKRLHDPNQIRPDETRPITKRRRISHLLGAKGADTKGNLNVHGHAVRTDNAAQSNEIRRGPAGNSNDKRTPEQIQSMGNAARAIERKLPGRDD